ncbi:MAG: hypothetical protein M0R22_00225 [Dehalococcoidia bacterium]|jgi:hypothetical protein|nr:hypothetical protein [Dehalococcoidia bacterium]
MARRKGGKWAGKRRYCVSAGAPGFGQRIMACFYKKSNATKKCKALRASGNRCKVIGKAKGSHAGLKCCSWRKKCR